MEDLTAVPMDATDREHLAVILRDPGALDRTWLHGLIARYDIARSIKAAMIDRPQRVAFMCNPDESGGYAESDPKSEGWHSRRADLYDLRAGK